MHKRLMTAVTVVSMAWAGVVLAHDEAKAKAQHGGVVQVVNDVTFELVARNEGVAIYVADHGKPVSPAGMSGKLTVLNGTEKSEATLVAAGDRLVAKEAKVGKGSRVVAAITTADKKAITVRFNVQ